ncbi:sulfite reductase subunit alpha [Pseudomonas sp. MYb185]|uniref:sulfite reductase subunit alpha n=1 Tax=Pseudomonas sp. MYb185 TaxID=1848729 RepID=UPI000CFCB038|nr:sulfite reductase subunit alpha [Pseudomonas sp. MYb185]PRB74783.1 oxidoreductase [Pseudomonas sp. MYb185]
MELALPWLHDPFALRGLWAALAIGGWLLLCWYCLAPVWRHRRRSSTARADWLIAYASQSGAARQIAEQLALAARHGGQAPALLPLNELSLDELGRPTRALFVVSTYGEGEAPDNAALFWRRVRNQRPALHQLEYAVLALGDSQYADYCGFGRRLDQWLSTAGAQAAIPRTEVDRLDPDMLQQWRTRVDGLFGLPEVDASTADTFEHWVLADRQQLNPNSPGAPAWMIRLLPAAAMPRWQAGDLAQVRIGQLLRTYSIASLPEDGALELIVRQVINDDGSLGQGSGWLCQHADPGATLEIALRSNPQFHLTGPDCPTIFIGAGTGLAGLRALLKQRQRQGRRDNWLIFGERCRQHDRWLAEEIEGWAAQDLLTLDLCFSRTAEHAEYVQHRLAAKADQLRQWVDRGACIHVCGSLAGMGNAIHGLLQELLSAEQWQQLQRQNRYRRDLY